MSKPKPNCWEATGCGREPGGAQAAAQGICPAAVESGCNGFNGGINAGRYCWRIAGTFCDDSIQGTFAEKALNCSKCEFFLRVVTEEGPNVRL